MALTSPLADGYIFCSQGVENATKTTVNTSLDGKGAVADLASVVESAYAM